MTDEFESPSSLPSSDNEAPESPDVSAEASSDEPAKDAPELTFEEARVLGCLLEKEMSTPEYYPLTLKALQSACNQSSNREPVVSFDMDVVEDVMDSLRYKGYAIRVHQAGARVPKNKHLLDKKFPYLERPALAILCVLLLRGQQTLGELRQRTERLFNFADLDAAQAALDTLLNHEPDPLAKELPSGSGRRVATFVHLLCGDVAVGFGGGAESSAGQASTTAATPGAASAVATPSWREEVEERFTALTEEVSSLREEVRKLREELGA